VIFIITTIVAIPLILSLINFIYLRESIAKGKFFQTEIENNKNNSFSNKIEIFHRKILNGLMLNKITKVDKLFLTKRLGKNHFLFLITTLCELFLLMELSSKNFVYSTMDRITPVYNNSIDSRFSMDYKVD